MYKEWKLLFSGWWQLFLYVVIFGVLVAMGISVTSGALMAGLVRSDFAAMEGPYDTEKVTQINEKYGFYAVQRGNTQVSFGAEEEPHLVLERFYGQSYILATDHLHKIAEEKPEVASKAESLLENLQFFYTNGWRSYFNALASPTPSVPISSVFMVGLIILGANFLSVEYLQGTWLVIGNTLNGRKGILFKKFFVLTFTGVMTMLLVHVLSLLNLQSSGQIIHAHRRISEMLNTIPFWDMSFVGAALLNLFFWLLAVLLLISTILLISALLKKGLLTIIVSLLWVLGVPMTLNAILPMHPLLFPQNLMGMVNILISPGIEHDQLVQFLGWRPWLPSSVGFVMAYSILLPLLFTGLFLGLTKALVKRWY